MHSQMTDYNMTALRLDRVNRLLLGASQETIAQHGCCLSMHSLDAQTGMFASRYHPPALVNFRHVADSGVPLS